jgi:VCBS repeat-containing protein
MLFSDGLGASAHAHVRLETPPAHAPADAIVVPDAHFLFNADFKRSGLDLILSADGRELALHDYFKGEKRAALASPDGAHLTGDLVNALSGSVQVSQAGAAAAAGKVIGHVTKLQGTATAIRNGVSIILHQGDNVEKGDVVQSGSDSTLGITFIDGTVFGLSSNARMVLNEMVYDPNGSNNSSLISLVAGTISFVAGETAKHGDMKVDTPVATMGIRGTAVLVEIDFTVPGQGGLPDAKFQVLVEPDGRTGSYVLFDKTTLQPIAMVNQAGQQIQISNGVVNQSSVPLSPDIQKLINDVFTLKFTDNTNPKSTTHFTDVGVPQTTLPVVLANGTSAQPIFLITDNNGSTPTAVNTPPEPPLHIFGALDVRVLDANSRLTTTFALSERAGQTGISTDLDTVLSRVNFVDPNPGDLPSVSVSFKGYAYKSAQQVDVTASLSALQLQDVLATAVKIKVASDPANKNFGSATLTYSVPDSAFDFLAAGESLTLTYTVRVDNNYALANEFREVPITITVTGTNDKPVITTSAQTIVFAGR